MRGETHCVSAKEPHCGSGEAATIKADLRLVYGVDEYATAEVCKALPTAVNVSTDRTKLLIEGKFILNRMVGTGVTSVFLLYVAGNSQIR